MAPFDEVAKAELHKSSEDKDDLSWCPLVDGYQTKGLKTSLFRMNGGKLWLFFFCSSIHKCQLGGES